jgi:hypothetical protein
LILDEQLETRFFSSHAVDELMAVDKSPTLSSSPSREVLAR